nr:capsid protein [Cressdnaviricota sp.]
MSSKPKSKTTSSTRKSSYKKKTYYKKRRYGSSKISSVTVRGNPGFPDEFNTKLVYIGSATLAGGVPTPNAHVMNANGLYDPDDTSTGHQPKYYDQLTAMYGKYLVYGVKYEVQFNNGASTAAFGVVTFNETDISGRTVESLQENRYSQLVSLGQTAGSATATVKGYMSMAKLHGQAHIDSDPNQYASATSNPTDKAYMIIKVSSCDGTSNANVYIKFKLTYYCKFKDLQDPGQS